MIPGANGDGACRRSTVVDRFDAACRNARIALMAAGHRCCLGHLLAR
jgi:hypothetical protein